MIKSGKVNPLRDNKAQPKLQEYDQFAYCQAAIEMLEQSKTSSGLNFTVDDINDFCCFYLQYTKQKEFKKEELIQKCKEACIFQKSENQQDLLFQLRVADSAFHHDRNQQLHLRKTQLMAIYLYLKNPNRAKILMQILTGEGKTTIIACLAAVLYMRGFNVDIVTTNQMLAKRDQLQKQSFYNLLGIPVGTNFPADNDKKDEKAMTGPRDCYLNRGVVYGTPSSFQVDILFDEYKRKGTRNKRPFDVIIIDQVDLMFIDNKSSQTLLSSRYSGHSQLVTPMKIVWKQIVSNTKIRQGQKLFMYLENKKKKEIAKGEINEVMMVIIEAIKKEFKNQLIQDQKKQFVQFSLESWIVSAMEAAYCLEQGQDYIIKNRQIIPIDKSTGAHLKEVSWSNGLHQFLQIKHDLPVFPETMTSNFISNIGHFARYRMVLGLTGTLGSQSSRQFLKKTYDAVIIEIPSTFERKLIIDPGYFMFDHKRWMEKIIERCKEMINLNRSVLLVCSDIRTVQVVQQNIQKTMENDYIKLVNYTSGQEKHTEKVASKEVIIATNIAGRGMDFKPTQQLIQKGGLHVIVTYMPQNLRVQMQARGRAGRNGAPGSSELIVNHLEYFKECNLPLIDQQSFQNQKQKQNIKSICETIRDKRQTERMERENKRVKKIRIRDRLFSKFCKTVNEIPDFKTNKAKNMAIEETWSMFLKKSQVLKLKDKQFESQAETLIKRFATESESFYNINHNFERGFNKAFSKKKQDIVEAQKLFKQLKKEKNSLMQQVSGMVGEVLIKGTSIDTEIQTNAMKQDVINQMTNCLVKLAERKQIIRAQSMISNSLSSTLMKGQNQCKKRQLHDAINRTQVKNSKVNFSMLNGQKYIQQDVDKQAQVKALLRNAQQKFVEAIENNLKDQINALSKLKADETFTVKLKYLSEIIDRENISQNSQDQAALERLQSQVPLQPVVEIQKKKSEDWKRQLVFALGVAQICVGALLTYYSGGLLAQFGTNMIIQGLMDCCNAVFDHDTCADLQAFYTKKTLSYAISLSSIGLQGMQMMKQMYLKDFEFIQDSGVCEIIKGTFNGIKAQFLNSQFDWKRIVKNSIQMGTNTLLGVKQQEQLKVKQVTKRLIDSDTKTLISQATQQQQWIGQQSTKKCNQFANEISPWISKLSSQAFQKHFRFYQLFEMKDTITKKIIQLMFIDIHSPLFSIQKHEQVYKDIEEFLKRNVDEENITDKLIKEFVMEQQINMMFSQMAQSKFCKTMIKTQTDLVVSQLRRLLSPRKEILMKKSQQLKKQLDQIQTLKLYEKGVRMEKYHQKKIQLDSEVDEINAFENCQFDSFLSQQNLLEELMKMGVFYDKFRLNKNQYHPLLVEILTKFHKQYKNRDFNRKKFIELFESEIYNRFTSKILKIIPKLYEGFSRRTDILTVVQGKVFSEIRERTEKTDLFI